MINTPQAPYYDDFDPRKAFLKILFKPGISVQVRELEQLQSMFQEQVQTLADQLFTNGSVISGGKFNFKDSVDYVKLYTTYNNNNFVYTQWAGRSIYGLTSNIVARVFNGWNQSLEAPSSLYINYLNGGTNNESTFQPGEVLQVLNKIYISISAGTISIGDVLNGSTSGANAKIVNIHNNELEVLYTSTNTFQLNEQIIDTTSSAVLVYNSGESVIYQAQVMNIADDANPVGFGTAVYVDEGIYYIDGYFTHASNQNIIVSKYTRDTSARIGFEKEMEIVTSSQDTSLLDNAGGYPNENAPGADRLKLNLRLNYYNLYESPSVNFIEIMRVVNSEVTGNTSASTQYSTILDTLARRTYDESGNYTVKPFIIDIQEFLDENDNNGIYKETFFGYDTQSQAIKVSIEVFGEAEPGSVHTFGSKYYPCASHIIFLNKARNMLALGINPGKAYVMGYEINQEYKLWIPLQKARNTNIAINSPTSVLYGNYIKVTNLYGLPNIAVREKVNLSSDSTWDGAGTPTIIGSARIFAIEHDSGTYGSSTEVYKVYIDEIEMTTGNFSNDVNSMGIDQDFGASLVKTGGVNQLFGMDQSVLIFPLPLDKVSSVNNSSYNYKKIFSGQVVVGGGGLGTITLPADSNAQFLSPSDTSKYILTITSGTRKGEIIPFSTVSVTIDGSGNLSITGLPANTTGENYMILTTFHKSVNNIKTKTLTSNQQMLIASPTSDNALEHADGYRLIAVYDSGDIDTPATTSSTVVTQNWSFDNGQRDTYYDKARIRLKSGAQGAVGQILVVYDFFSHSSGDYFTVDSYLTQIPYTSIPSYTSGLKTYDLKDCIDARPRVDDGTSGNFTNSTVGNIFDNSSIFESDISYYLPRLDLLELDYRGNFNIKYGTPADDPKFPVGSINAMILYYLQVGAYTESPNEVARIYRENKRYTMRDIGSIDNRVSAIEEYINLSSQELDTANMPIFDANGDERWKTGFIVDMFYNHDYGDTLIPGYRCAVDSENGQMKSDYKIHSLGLNKSTVETSTVSEAGGKYVIPSTEDNYLSNQINTGFFIMNSNQLVSWVGNILLGHNIDNSYNPVDTSEINYGTGVTASGSILSGFMYHWFPNPTVR